MAGVKVLVLAGLLLTAAVAAAQDAPVQVQGRVTWIAGQGLVVVPDGNTPVKVDISQVPQDERATLREGDRIVVTGNVNNERTRVVATSIQRVGPLSSR
jgi:hypothetical protein